MKLSNALTHLGASSIPRETLSLDSSQEEAVGDNKLQLKRHDGWGE